MQNLEGRIAIVTGAASGIGAAVAAVLNENGAVVIGFDLAGNGIDIVPVDIAARAQVDRAVAQVAAEHGRIGILVNCAGTGNLGTILDLEPEEWDRVMAINLTGSYAACRAVLPSMLAQGSGAIVNIASTFGLMARENCLAYGVSKAGVIHMTRLMAVDLGDSGVRVNCVCPGLIETAMTSSLYDELAVVQAWVRGGGLHNGRCPTLPTGRIVADVTETVSAEKKTLHTAMILNVAKEAGIAPVVFLSMVSPVLDVGMRVEIPLRAVLQGNPPLDNTYMVYLHTLLTSEGRNLVYYGITKRGWNLRFIEHTRSAVAQKSRRLFARTMRDLVTARVEELYGNPNDKPKLRGLITTIIATGLCHGEALDVEEAMVEKYSLASRHRNGLNMIPGGAAGLRRAASFKQKR